MFPRVNTTSNRRVDQKNSASRSTPAGSLRPGKVMTESGSPPKISKKRGLYVETESNEQPASLDVTEHLKRMLPVRIPPQRSYHRESSPIPGRSDSRPTVWSVLDSSTSGTSTVPEHIANDDNTILELQNAILEIKANSKPNKKKRSKLIELHSGSNFALGHSEIEKTPAKMYSAPAKQKISNRYSFAFVHEEKDRNNKDLNVKRRVSTQPSNRKVLDLNLNPQQPYFDSDSEIFDTRKVVAQQKSLKSRYCDRKQDDSKNLVVLQSRKDFDKRSSSNFSNNSEEVEVHDYDSVGSSKHNFSHIKTILGNEFYYNPSERFKSLLKQNIEESFTDEDDDISIKYDSERNEVFTTIANNAEVPIINDVMDDLSDTRSGIYDYDTAKYCMIDSDLGLDEIFKVKDRLKQKESLNRTKNIYVPKKSTVKTIYNNNYGPPNSAPIKPLKKTTRNINAEKRRKLIEKEKLLNLIKQRLSIDEIDMNPPHSIFEELREMAKHKRKSHKSVSFSPQPERFKGQDLRDISAYRNEMFNRYNNKKKRTAHEPLKAANAKTKDFFDKVRALNQNVINQNRVILANNAIKENYYGLSDIDDDTQDPNESDHSLEVYMET